MALKQRAKTKEKIKFAYDDYLAYIARANKHDLIIEEIVDVLSRDLYVTNTARECWNMLDVGCGDGLLSIKLVEKLLPVIDELYQHKKVSFDMLDPSSKIIDNLSKEIREKVWNKKVAFRYLCQSLENYLNNLQQLNQLYDGILCSHCYYHIVGWDHAIDRLIELLKPNGWLCIVLVSDKTDLYQFRDKISPLLVNCDPVKEDGEYVFGKDIESLLKTKAIPFKKSTRDSYITFTKKDIENIDIIYRVLGFLYRYALDDIKDRCSMHIDKFIDNNRDREGNIKFLYKDEFFWIWR